MDPSSSIYTGVVIVNIKFEALTSRFVVKTTPEDTVDSLKLKVQEKRHGVGHSHVTNMTVWLPKGSKKIMVLTPKRMAQALASIDTDNAEHIRVLGDGSKVANLGMSEDETLIVQLLAEDSPVVGLGEPITMQVDSEYEPCFIRVSSQGSFLDRDVELNDIYDVSDDSEIPTFVRNYEDILGRKRIMAPDLNPTFTNCFCRTTMKTYFSSESESAATRSDALATAMRPEINHIIHIASVDSLWWEIINPEIAKGDFKECDSYWLFFYAIKRHYGTLTSNARLATKQSLQSWPFELLINFSGNYHTYKPRSDFLAMKFTLPRLAVEVNSNPRNKDTVDFYRLMLQGASVVRFANKKLDAFKHQKNFVFMAVYISITGQVQRYLLYQNKKVDPKKVYRKLRTFKLATLSGRLGFALELYNFPSTLHASEDGEDTRGHVIKLTNVINEASRKHKLQAFTAKSKASCQLFYRRRASDQPTEYW